MREVSFATADVGGPVGDAANDRAHVPAHAGGGRIAVRESDIVIRADEGNIRWHFQAVKEEKLHGGHEVGHLVHDQGGWRRGAEERAEAVMESRVGFLPIWKIELSNLAALLI